MSENFLPFGFSIVLTYILTRFLIPVAPKLGLMDVPTSRKKHAGEIPLIGGLAIYVSVLACSMLFVHLQVQILAIITLGGLLTTIGTLDDKYGLSANLRLGIQLVTGVLLAIGAKIELGYLGDIFGLGPITCGILAIPFTAIGIAALSNAYNMTDGIDGLAASLGIIAFSFLILSLHTDMSREELLTLSFYIISLSTYLIFNFALKPFAPTKVFMGDAGSMFIGFSVAAFAIYFSQNKGYKLEPSTTLWFVAIPLFDMISTMARRILRGHSPFFPDRTHLHHIILRLGLSSKTALIIIVLCSITLSCVGYIMHIAETTPHISFGAFIVTFCIYFISIHKAASLKPGSVNHK